MSQLSPQQLREEKTKYWQPLLQRWQQGQLSATEFCRKNNLNLHQFKYWQYQLLPGSKKENQGMNGGPVHFTEIKPMPQLGTTTATATLEVVCIRGHRIKIHEGFDVTTLRRLLEVLEAL